MYRYTRLSIKPNGERIVEKLEMRGDELYRRTGKVGVINFLLLLDKWNKQSLGQDAGTPIHIYTTREHIGD